MIIYGIENTLTNKWYIGQTTSPTINRRITQHWRDLKKGISDHTRLQQAVNTYGVGVFTATPLASARHKLELDELEKIYIGLYNSYNDGYNMNDGGGGKVAHSEETKKKMSYAQKGRIISEEHRKKLSDAAKGRTLSAETKKKMSDAQTLRWINERQNVVNENIAAMYTLDKETKKVRNREEVVSNDLITR